MKRGIQTAMFRRSRCKVRVNGDQRSAMTLQQKLDDLKAKFESGGPPRHAPRAIIETMRRGTREQRESGLAERALKTGDRGPAFTLNNQEGNTVSSLGLLAKG